MHLWLSLAKRIPVIGVAKSNFRGTPEEAKLYRGNSRRPLFISCMGLPLDEAQNYIARMHGEYRIPTLLKSADRLSRTGVQDARAPNARIHL